LCRIIIVRQYVEQKSKCTKLGGKQETREQTNKETPFFFPEILESTSREEKRAKFKPSSDSIQVIYIERFIVLDFQSCTSIK
jgi:hypothetical protein